jgi:integrase
LTRPIAEITTAEIDDYLRGLAVSPRSRQNIRSALISAFEFAKSRGYLPRDRASAAKLSSRVKVREGDVEIFTPTEMAAMLEAADTNTIPILVLGGFCGIRSAEILRLDWREVDFEQCHVTIGAAKAKTAARRIVPLSPNAVEWLSPYRNRTGLIVPSAKQRVSEWLNDCAKKAGVTWKHNALRHSYGSYRLAAIKNAPEVALEMGNSPNVVFKHYRELVTPRDTAAWWAIRPKRAGNVIPMQAKAGAASE